jgi:DNA-binding NarL/FixJ family response regulator
VCDAHQFTAHRGVSGRVHILIIERDAMARRGLQQVVSAGTDLAVSATAATIREAAVLAAATPVDVVLVGHDVTDLDGTEGIDHLLTRFVRARVVLLGEETTPGWLVAALRAGADGVLPRPIAPAALTQALRGVARGEAALSDTHLVQLVAALRVRPPVPRADHPFHRLSPREQDVVAEIAAGRTNADIADWLGLRESTVKTHVSSILRKTGARSRTAIRLPQRGSESA